MPILGLSIKNYKEEIKSYSYKKRKLKPPTPVEGIAKSRRNFGEENHLIREWEKGHKRIGRDIFGEVKYLSPEQVEVKNSAERGMKWLKESME